MLLDNEEVKGHNYNHQISHFWRETTFKLAVDVTATRAASQRRQCSPGPSAIHWVVVLRPNKSREHCAPEPARLRGAMRLAHSVSPCTACVSSTPRRTQVQAAEAWVSRGQEWGELLEFWSKNSPLPQKSPLLVHWTCEQQLPSHYVESGERRKLPTKFTTMPRSPRGFSGYIFWHLYAVRFCREAVKHLSCLKKRSAKNEIRSLMLVMHGAPAMCCWFQRPSATKTVWEIGNTKCHGAIGAERKECSLPAERVLGRNVSLPENFGISALEIACSDAFLAQCYTWFGSQSHSITVCYT